MKFIVVCNQKRKPNQNTTRARIVIAEAGVVIAGARIIITGARIIIAGTLCVFWGKSHKNRFLLTIFLVFSGKISNKEKNAGPCNHAWPVSAHRAKNPVPQSPSSEANKFTCLENLVPIPSRNCPLRARPAVQIHDYHLYFRSRPDQPIEFIKKNQIFFWKNVKFYINVKFW